ncbi:exodeoxyribonuclease VII small subunit [Roseospira goensis]|uniref:Exodeoxyribonuclease 7 small subunit n=1 Tax=Roseospira goensis TaxID=391922 RepID=A0A7W6WK62_9PROT|nr:exodeoxyribonuclease VII small subunit [Roseospira goensis]
MASKTSKPSASASSGDPPPKAAAASADPAAPGSSADPPSGPPSGPPEDIARLSFEEALRALEEIVQHLETGRVDLDAAVAAYERGVWLRKHCEARLGEARAKVERIGTGTSTGADGGVTTAPLDVE